MDQPKLRRLSTYDRIALAVFFGACIFVFGLIAYTAFHLDKAS